MLLSWSLLWYDTSYGFATREVTEVMLTTYIRCFQEVCPHGEQIVLSRRLWETQLTLQYTYLSSMSLCPLPTLHCIYQSFSLLPLRHMLTSLKIQYHLNSFLFYSPWLLQISAKQCIRVSNVDKTIKIFIYVHKGNSSLIPPGT